MRIYLLIIALFVSALSFGQNTESQNLTLINIVRNNTLSPAKVANALDALNYSKMGITSPFTASGTDTYAASVNAAITSYAAAPMVTIKFTNANTGPATINLNSIGAKTILKQGSALTSGDILAGVYYILVYDGTDFQLIGDGGTSGGGGDFSTITGDPRDNSQLADYLDEKGDALVTANVVTGAHTLNSTDLGIINAGGQLDVQGNNGGALTIPLNSSVAFPVGSSLSASGFTGSVIATGGVTITGTRGDLVFPSGASVFLQKTATDTWTLNNGLPTGTGSTAGLTKLYTATGTNTDGAMDQNSAKTALDAKQATLVSGTNIKTVNGNSLVGSGGISVGDALVANPLSQFAATTSLQLAGVVSDETGTDKVVLSNAPTLVNPVVGTQTAGDNSTKAASTAYVDALIMPAATSSTNGYLTSTDWTTFNGKQASGLSYLLASGGTATGNNLYTHTGFTRKYIWDNLATTHTNGYGHWIANTTAAAAGVQQKSPAFVWEGQGWKTNATAASQSVMAKAELMPIQGAANPTSSLNFAFSTNGAAYSSDVFQIRSGLTVPIICDGVGFSITNGGISLSSAAPITNTLVFGTNGTISSAGLVLSSGNGGVTLGTSMSYVYSPASGSVSATTLQVATNFAPTSIYSGGTFRSVYANPTYNNVGTNTAIGFDFNPTRTNVTGLTEYGILIRPTQSNSGFGTATPTATVHVVGTTKLEGSVTLPVAGNGFLVKEGTNATMGVATLSSGTVTVNTTKVTATSRIFLTVNGGTLTNVGFTYISARSAGTSFTITSSDASDASDVAWLIVEPAP